MPPLVYLMHICNSYFFAEDIIIIQSSGHSVTEANNKIQRTGG